MTTGKLTSIKEALDYKLSTLSLSPSRRVAYEGTVFEPVVGEIYLRSNFIPNQTDLGGVGINAPRRHRGIYQVTVAGPTNVGTVTQSEVADLVIEHFVQQTITRNGLTVRVGSYDGSPSVPYAAPMLIVDGWLNIPVTIPWWCDTF